MLNLI